MGRTAVIGAMCAFVALVPGTVAAAAAEGSPDIVISQAYGGGGNTGAPYRNDFVELFNRGTTTVSLSGWSVQYASAAGTGNFADDRVALSGSVAPGRYHLVQLAAGTSGGDPLPTPDTSATSPNASASSGKLIVARTVAGLACNGGSTPCSAAQLEQIADLVGYGSANFFEGAAAAPGLSNTTAAFRGDGGCTDTDENGADVSAAPPAPRNSLSPTHFCDRPQGVGAADPSTVTAGEVTRLTVAITPAMTPPSTGLAVSGDLSAIGGAPDQQFFDDGTNGDAAAGDSVFSYEATVAAGTAVGSKQLPVSVTDAEGRTGSASIELVVGLAPHPVTIADLAASVGALGLPGGLQRSLLAKLEGAQRNSDDGDGAGACDKLASFANQVAAQSDKTISASDAEQLAADAEAVSESLGCP